MNLRVKDLRAKSVTALVLILCFFNGCLSSPETAPQTLQAKESWLQEEASYAKRLFSDMEPEYSEFFKECLMDSVSGGLPCIGCSYELRSIDGHLHPFLYKGGELLVDFNHLLKETENLSHLRFSHSFEKVAFISEDQSGSQILYVIYLIPNDPHNFTISRLSIATMEFGGEELFVVIRDESLHPLSIASIKDGLITEKFRVPPEINTLELSPSSRGGVIATLTGKTTSSIWITASGTLEIVPPRESPFKIVDTDTRRFMLERPGEEDSVLFYCEGDCRNKIALLASNEKLLLADLEPKDSNLIIYGRENGLESILLLNDSLEKHEIKLQGGVGEAKLLRSYPGLHFLSSSLKSPPAILRVEENSGNSSKIWSEKIEKYDELQFHVSRIFTPSDPKLSVSVIEQKGGTNSPIVLTAYGAYGAPASVKFPREFLPLIRRGISFGAAHVRGGGEHGKKWHLQGRGVDKGRGVSDLREIIHEIGAQRKIGLLTRSAGGILGANLVLDAPKSLVATVLDRPFLDPFQRGILEENSEWGDLNDPQAVDSMRKWSPFKREIPRALPKIYINASPRDVVVPFDPISDWARRIRASDASSLFAFGISSNGSHVGGSTREVCEDRARINAFMFKALKVKD